LRRLTVLDLSLPRVDRLEVRRLLKRLHATAATKVLILTAHQVEEAGAAAPRFGADAYVTRPLRRARSWIP